MYSRRCSPKPAYETAYRCHLRVTFGDYTTHQETYFNSYWTFETIKDRWDLDIARDPTFQARAGLIILALSGIRSPNISLIQHAYNMPMKVDDTVLTDLRNKSTHFYSNCWFYPCANITYGPYIDPFYKNGSGINHSQTSRRPSNRQMRHMDC